MLTNASVIVFLITVFLINDDELLLLLRTVFDIVLFLWNDQPDYITHNAPVINGCEWVFGVNALLAQRGALWSRTDLSWLKPEMSSCMFLSHSCCRIISCFSC